MSIKKVKNKPKKAKFIQKAVKPSLESLTEPHDDDALVELIETMQSVDINSPDAKLNETSMSDGQGGRITYFLTQDIADDLKKDKNTIREKWLELLVKRRMLQKLLDEARKISGDTSLEDYVRACITLRNTHKLMMAEGKEKFDREILWAAALFHSYARRQDKEVEHILKSVKDFPKEKIVEVKRLITGINSDPRADDEVLITTATDMTAFSVFSLAEALVEGGRKGLKTKEALERELNLIEKRYQRMKLESGKKLSEQVYRGIKQLIEANLKQYEE